MRIARWLRQHRIEGAIYNDRSDDLRQPCIAMAAAKASLGLFEARQGLRLAGIYQDAGQRALDARVDAVLIIESDCEPTMEVLDRMKEAWTYGEGLLEAEGKSLASVSPVYRNNGRYVYPVGRDWFQRDHVNCRKWHLNEQLGEIAFAEAVPFVFSLWRPNLLAEIDPQLAHVSLISLDKLFGRNCYIAGYDHLRLLSHSVPHVGRQSRKPSRSPLDDVRQARTLLDEWR